MDDPREEQPQEIEEQERPKPSRKPKKVAVKPIVREGMALCIQYQDGKWPRRTWVPAEEVSEGQISEDVLAAAIPASIAWEERLDVSLDVGQLALRLYQRGIFNSKDAAANKPGSMQAIMESLEPVYIQLLRLEE